MSRLRLPAAAGCAALMGLAAGPLLAQEAVAQESDAADEYARILQQIADTQTNIDRMEFLLARQEARTEELRAQIAATPGKLAAYTPVLTRFVSQLEGVIENDIPFRRAERYERLAVLQEIVADNERTLGDKMTRALQAANIETSYGYDVESYDANHPTDAGRRYRACTDNPDSDACALTEDMREDMEGGRSIPQMELELTDGSYIRYGRLSLAYVDTGTDEMLVFDPAAREWREARGSEEAGIRRNLRIARGESAPDVVEAPVVKTN